MAAADQPTDVLPVFRTSADVQAAPDEPPKRKRRYGRWIAAGVVGVLVYPLVGFVWMRYENVPFTGFQAGDGVRGIVENDPTLYPHQSDMDIRFVSRNFLAALIVLEDGRYPQRWHGTDWAAFSKRTWRYLVEHKNQGGSTIAEQITKNLYSPIRGFGWLRQPLDAFYGDLAPIIVGRQRLFELYVNHIEFARGIYGICAASWAIVGKAPATLTVEESAALIARMPDPKQYGYYPDGAPFTWQQIRNAGGLAALLSPLGIHGDAEHQTGSGSSCATPPRTVVGLMNPTAQMRLRAGIRPPARVITPS
jgi:monofunctional biosynthetic peptidoglycan transglycosylase